MRHRTLLGLCALGALTFGCTSDDDATDAGPGVEDGGQHSGPDAGGSGGSGGTGDDAGVTTMPTDAAMSMPMPDEDGGTTDAATDAGGASAAVRDPAPDAITPGEHGCTGCPDTDLTDFELDLGNVTSSAFMGTVTGASGNGEFYLESEGGQSIGGTIATSDSGAYSFTIPLFCGTQTLKLVWTNDTGTYVAVLDVVTADCVDADIRIALTWDDKGLDYELHLVKEGGRINDLATDCTWTSCISTSPDWGTDGDAADNPHKDVDNTGTFGPENIFYPMPEDGTYTVMVEHWGAGAADSDGEVTINLLGSTPVVIPITDLASHHVFTAATIEWPSKDVTVVASDYDCTTTWAGGCTAQIP